jgi:hypothetical protein
MKLNRQGIRVLDDPSQNNRRDRQHQFTTTARYVADENIAGQFYIEHLKCCIHCELTLDRYDSEDEAHLRVPSIPRK